jgi:hypothetical protein
MERRIRGNRSKIPGFFAAQSAHLSLPGTERMRSCRARSLRACWRLFIIADMIIRDSNNRRHREKAASQTIVEDEKRRHWAGKGALGISKCQWLGAAVTTDD